MKSSKNNTVASTNAEGIKKDTHLSPRRITIIIVMTAIVTLPLIFNACSGSGYSPVDFGSAEEGNASISSNCPTQAFTGALELVPDVVTYEEHVKPLIFTKVCSECHGSIPGLPNWLDYNQAFAKKDVIRFRVTNKIMPPANAKINSLTADEIALVQKWVDTGAARGGAGGGGTTPSPVPQEGCPPPEGTTTGATDVPAPSNEPPPILDPPPPANPTYMADLKPKLFTPICGSCHGVRPDLPNWQNYDEASDRADKIRRKVLDGEMPPPSSGIVLTDNQKEMVKRWVDQGAPYQ